MAQALATTEERAVELHSSEHLEDYVTFFIADQMFGISVLGVQDILTPDRIAPIPLAPPEVKGAINLRGRIVTVIDVRTRLGLKRKNLAEDHEDESMGVTVEHRNELYTLLVDQVGDVISLSGDDYEDTPRTLDPVWREFAAGVYRLKGRLMVVLDVGKMLNLREG